MTELFHFMEEHYESLVALVLLVLLIVQTRD